MSKISEENWIGELETFLRKTYSVEYPTLSREYEFRSDMGAFICSLEVIPSQMVYIGKKCTTKQKAKHSAAQVALKEERIRDLGIL